ncbi:MAG: diguanylate cyclase [Sphingobacteriia bacterium]|nr:diguanylate cyclase [Sphingobacteriia bacterium]NCC38283.1 diguanylate cyclase [Gammaproteobacteria bacterium]
MTQNREDDKPNEPSPELPELRERAISALRLGRFDLAEDLLAQGEVSLSVLMENARIYQAELEIQNEELIAAQQEGLAALARFTAFFNTLPIAELVLDTYGLVLEANPEARRLFALRSSPIHQYFFTRLVREADRERVVSAWSALAVGERITVREAGFRSTDGHELIGDLHIARLPATHHEPSRFVCAVLDRSAAIEERLRAVEEAYGEARASEEHYRTLFEAASEGIGIIRQQRYVSVNPAAVSMLGYASAAEVIGKQLGELSPSVQPDGQPSVAKANRLATLALQEGTQRFQWDCLHHDGHLVPLMMTLTPVRITDESALLVTWRDLSGERLARERERLAQTVFDNTTEGIVITDAELHILAVNPAFTKITGFSEADVLGRSLGELSADPPDLDVLQDAARASLRESGFWRGESNSRRKSGEVYSQLTTISAVRGADGMPETYVCVFSDISQIKQAEQALQHLAHHDELTGLPNRVAMRFRAERALQRAQRDAVPLAFLFLDLDLFKRVNDTLGHHAGDALLRDVAKSLAKRLRGRDSIARIGGDEFVVLMEDLVEPREAGALAQRLIDLFKTPFRVMGQDCHIGVSIGISLFPTDGRDMDALLSRADMAMYHAKQRGRLTFCFFDPVMEEGARLCMRMENALHEAIEHGQVSLEYQPVMRLADGGLSAAEAHVVWEHPQLEQIPPERFLRRSADAGLCRLFGAWMLRRICHQIVAWDRAGLQVPRITIKLSTRWFEREDVIDEIRAILQETGVGAERIEIEIDESLLRESPEQVPANLHALGTLGMALAVAETGLALGALADLKRLPVRRLKLSNEMLISLAGDPDGVTLGRAVVALARALKLSILVEGVATAVQAELVKGAGCDEAQGSLYGCPVPPEAWLSGEVAIHPH